MYDLVKSMYLEDRCAVKIGDKQTEFFTQRRCVRQECNLSPTLFDMYTNKLATQLDQCAVPGLSLLDREVKSLFYADNLVPLSPTEQGLRQTAGHNREVFSELDPSSKYEEN